MSKPTQPERLSAAEAAAAIRAGQLTSQALVEACLARIAAREPTVHAWVHCDPEQALAQARALDRMAPAGPLHGVPIGAKDIIDTFDMPTRHGSPIYQNNQPDADAACVALCRDAGMVILGKTVTTEFANRHPGPTTNPHNPAHTPGGSSSGSAAGVADAMLPLGFGTQDGGLGDPGRPEFWRRDRLQAELRRDQSGRRQAAVRHPRHGRRDGARARRPAADPRGRDGVGHRRRSTARLARRASASAVASPGVR